MVTPPEDGLTELLHSLWQMERVYAVYDRASGLAEQIFSEAGNKRWEINRIFEQKRGEIITQKELLELAAAYNYAMIKADLELDSTGEGSFTLQQLLQRESAMMGLVAILADAQIDFTQLCIDNKRLMLPRDIDQIIKSRIETNSHDSWGNYGDKEGYALVAPFDEGGRKGYVISFYYDNSVSTRYIDVTQGKFPFKKTSFLLWEGDPNAIDRIIQQNFNGIGITNYGITRAKDRFVITYLMFKFGLEKTRKMKETGEIPTLELKPSVWSSYDGSTQDLDMPK